MSGESPAQNMLCQGGGGGAHGSSSNTGATTTATSALGSMMPNSVGSPAGAEGQLNATQLPSNQGSVPQNLGTSVANYLGHTQILGQQKPVMGRQQQQPQQQQQQLLACSPALQVPQNLGSNPIQSPTGSHSLMHRSSSGPRLGQYNSSAGRSSTLYGHTQYLQHQQQSQMGRSGMIGQGQGSAHLSILSGHPGQLSNFNSQFLSQQVRQKQGQTQNSQFQQPVSSGQSLQSMQPIGMMGPLGLGPQNRMSGSPYAQQRIGQGTLRSPPSQSPQQSLSSPQKIQSQNLQRVPSLGSMNPHLSGLSQGGQSAMTQSSVAPPQHWAKMHQPNLPSTASPSYQLQQQQQRQQQAQMQQQAPPSPSQQQPTISHPQQLTQQHSQQAQQEQIQQSLQSQQISRTSPLTAHVPAVTTGSLSGTPTSGLAPQVAINNQVTESSSHILGKRSIQDLVSQVDSHEKLDPAVEDILLDIAEDFIHSVTSFACALAKHRKSSTLEAKDVLLHLEKNWHLSIPGFTGKECKTNKSHSVNEAHLQRLAVIQKSMASPQIETEAGSINDAAGPATGSSNAGIQEAKALQNSTAALPFSTGYPGVQQKVPRF